MRMALSHNLIYGDMTIAYKNIYIAFVTVVFICFSPIAAHSSFALNDAVGSGSIATIKKLLDATPVLIGQKDTNGQTALFDAVNLNKIDITVLLLEYGADPNVIDISNRTPLNYAAFADNVTMVRCLLDHHATLPNGPYLELLLEDLIKKNDINVLKYLLEDKISIFQNNLGFDLLKQAAISNTSAIAQIILDNGIKVNCCDGMFLTPLHYAVKYNSTGVVETLLKAKADLNCKDRYGNTPLYYCTSGDIAALLINNHALISVINKNGDSILQKAIVNCSFPVVKLLLDNDVEINWSDSNGWTPLFFAAEMGQDKMVSLLLNKQANPKATDKYGLSPLHYASTPDVAELLWKAGFVKSQDVPSPLDIASAHDFLPVVQFFVSHKYFASDEKTVTGQTPLMYWAKGSCGLVSTANYLLKNGASIHEIDNNGNSILHFAMQNQDNRTITEFLIEKGIDINALNNKGENSLDIACESGNQSVVDFLLSKGADVANLTLNSDSTLNYAIKGNNDYIVQEVLSKSDSINHPNKAGIYPIHLVRSGSIVRILMTHGADVNLTTDEGLTALHTAVLSGKIDVVNAILSFKPDIEARDKHLRTVLHLAVKSGSAQIVRLLLDSDSEVNAKDDNKNTPLHYAVENNDIQSIRLLKSHYADINAVNNEGKTPCDIAHEHNRKDIIDILNR